MKKKLSLIFSLLAVSTAAFAGSADDVTVSDPYVRQAPPNASASAAFMVLRNTGAGEAKLIGASNTASKVSELHTHINDNGVMRMRQVAEIVIPAHGETRLQPGGFHVMMIGLKAPLNEGETVPFTLNFADGSSKTLTLKVLRMMPAGGMPMSGGGMQHQHGQH